MLVNGGILLYFLNKYQETKLRTTLYWVLSYGFFVFALALSIVLGLTFISDVTEILTVQEPFVLLGLTTLTMSAISTGILGENSIPWEIVTAILGLVGFVLFYIPLESAARNIFIIMSILTVIAYLYLAISGRNARIGIITIGLLLQAVSGRLSTQGVIDTNLQLVFNSIGQIGIAVGLLGIGLRRDQA